MARATALGFDRNSGKRLGHSNAPTVEKAVVALSDGSVEQALLDLNKGITPISKQFDLARPKCGKVCSKRLGSVRSN